MIEGFPYKDALLPKIWLQKLPGFGELTIPKNYPESSSEFSLDFTPEDAEVIREMEANLGTEDSIITPEMVPDREAVGGYLGTFDVTGEAGVETLLSPIAVPSTAVNAIAMHYTDNETWNQIEDAHIVDGYVYGTVDSFSPIAVFVTRRDTFIDDTKYCSAFKALICNGIPVYIHLDDEGKPVAEDGYGKVIDLEGVGQVIGGSIDGTDLDSTSITIDGVNTIDGIRAGSFSDDLDNVAHVKKAVVTIKNVDNRKLGVTGGYYGSITDEFIFNVENSTYNWSGAGESIWQMAPSSVTNKDSGTGDSLSKGRTKKYVLNAKDSKAVLVYLGCNCGLAYNDLNEGHVDGCEFGYLITGGSNGGTNKSSVEVKNSKIDIFQTNNRGYINQVDKATFKDCEVTHLFVAGDSTDSTVTGVTKHIGKIEVNGESDVIFYVGTQNGQLIANHAELAELVDKIAISRDAKFEFGDENGASLFGDSISIK